MSQSADRQVAITADDHGPMVNIAAWFLMVMMTLAVLIRVAIKHWVRGSLKVDDITISISLLFGIGHVIATSLAVQYGLGKKINMLSSSDIQNLDKTFYASTLLFVVSESLAKISVLQLLAQLMTAKSQQNIVKAAIVAVIIYTVPLLVTVSLQCGVHEPWAIDNGHCINDAIVWTVFGTLGVLIEFVILMLPFVMVYQVQMTVSKKTAVVIAFVFRILVIAAVIYRLDQIYVTYHVRDYTFALARPSIATELVLSLSITSACIPCLKPFLDGFESGALDVAFGVKKSPLSSGNKDLTYRLYHINNDRSATTNTPPRSDLGHQTTVRQHSRHSTKLRGTPDHPEDDASSIQSNTMIIKRTDQWEIHYDETDPASPPPPRKHSGSYEASDTEIGEFRNSSLG